MIKKTKKDLPKPGEGVVKLRPYQLARFRHEAGLMAYVARRQSGKSYGLAADALDWMMESVCDVVFASAALRLGQENIRKEADVWRQATGALRATAAAAGMSLETSADDDAGNLLDVDAIADLFEHQKLETKVWHDRTRCSRSLVVAPNPETAVGWSGNVILDEVGRMPDFQEVFEAMEPIVSSNKGFKIRFATTPPPDDAHYSYELLAPPPGMEDALKPDARGSWYLSRAGILVHRCDAWDCELAGVPLYDLQTREPLTPEQHRERAVDKTAWDRNYGLRFVRGGSAAISFTALMHAQANGRETGEAINITEELVA
jgi:hypothetical protein